MRFYENLFQTGVENFSPGFISKKRKSFIPKKIWPKPRVNWIQYQNNQLCLLTQFSPTVLVMTSLLWSINWCICITLRAHYIPQKDIFFGALIHVLIRMMIYGAVPWEYITRIVFTYTYVRTHHHLFFMHDEK